VIGTTTSVGHISGFASNRLSTVGLRNQR
jgi:hypothetical protein